MFDTEAVKSRLESFGYEVKAEDESALTFCVEKVRSTVRNEINHNEVPDGLEHIAVDMAVGEFLLAKKTFAPDDLEMLDLDYAVKRNEINHNEVPDGLEHIAVDMAVGEFLLAKKTFAPDDLEMLDLDYAVKQIQTGDTNTVFATGSASLTPEQRLTAFINYLLSYGRGEFHSFRCIRW